VKRRDFLKALGASGAFLIVPYKPKLLGAPEHRVNREDKIYYVHDMHWFEIRTQVGHYGRDLGFAWYGLCPNKNLVVVEYGNAIWIENYHHRKSDGGFMLGVIAALWADFKVIGNKNGFFTQGAPSLNLFKDKIINYTQKNDPPSLVGERWA